MLIRLFLQRWPCPEHLPNPILFISTRQMRSPAHSLVESHGSLSEEGAEPEDATAPGPQSWPLGSECSPFSFPPSHFQGLRLALYSFQANTVLASPLSPVPNLHSSHCPGRGLCPLGAAERALSPTVHTSCLHSGTSLPASFFYTFLSVYQELGTNLDDEAGTKAEIGEEHTHLSAQLRPVSEEHVGMPGGS